MINNNSALGFFPQIMIRALVIMKVRDDIMMTSSNGNISTSLALCAGNSPAPGEFPAQRPMTRSFDVFFDLRLSKRLSKQPWGWWFETLSRPLWRQCNDVRPPPPFFYSLRSSFKSTKSCLNRHQTMLGVYVSKFGKNSVAWIHTL